MSRKLGKLLAVTRELFLRSFVHVGVPLSHARRPLVLLTVSYALLLALLKAWGAFEPAGAPPRPRRVALVGRVASACVETGRGDRLDIEAAIRGSCERVEAYLPRGSCDSIAPLPGQTIETRGTLRSPRRWLSPGDFDEAEVLAARGVRLVLQGERTRVVEAAVPFAWGPRAWAERLRRSAHAAFRSRLGPDDSRLMEGLLFGYKGSLSRGLQRQIQDAGAMHLIVPSGAKVGFIVWGLAWLLSRCGLSSVFSLAAAACVGAFYCLMAGAEAPYLRAYAAALAALAAALWPGREPGGLQAIAVSALAILLAWPRALFSAGFQMSYAAALALWVAARRWRPDVGPSWARGPLRVLMISLAVQLALWPLLANVFGRASVVGLVANIVLIPASAWLMGCGLALWASCGWPAAAALSARATAWGLFGFKWVCAACAALPSAAVDLVPMSACGVIVWYLASLGLFLLPDWKPSAAAGALAGAVLLFCRGAAWATGPRLDVCLIGDTRGWSALATRPSGEHIAVGAGLAPARLAAAWRELGARPVADWVIAREDRRPRGLAVVRRWPVRRVTRIGSPADIEFGRFRLRFFEDRDLATIRRGPAGPVEFCILLRPSATAPPWCAPAGIRGLGAEGALWITTDGERYQITSTGAGRPLRRPLL